MRQLHRLQFRLGTLLLVMAAIGVGIVVFRYPSQRRTAVKRTYEEQRKELDQSLEDFRVLLERDKLSLVARNSRHSDDNGEWRQSVELIGHKLRYKIGEPGEEVIGQFIVQGLVSRGADRQPGLVDEFARQNHHLRRFARRTLRDVFH